jgi:protein-disulfide isomerase
MIRVFFKLMIVAASSVAQPAWAQIVGGGSLAGIGHFRGDTSAVVSIVEFNDFGCSECARFNVETFPRISSDYIKRGIVRWKVVPWVSNAFRHSLEVSTAAECAGEQGKFWPMHDLLYLRRREWMVSRDVNALVATYATRLGLDASAFAACMSGPDAHNRIVRNSEIARQLALRGTPMFFVNGRLVPGAVPFELFQKLIAEAQR